MANNNTPKSRHLLNDELDLNAVWRVLMYRKWSIISFVVIVSMLATLIVLSMTPIYRATTTLLIEPKKNQVVSAEELFGLDTSRGEYLATQFELLKNRELVERVVLRNNLIIHPELLPEEKEGLSRWLDWRRLIKEFDVNQFLPVTLPTDLEEQTSMTLSGKLGKAANELKNRIDIAPLTEAEKLEKVILELTSRITIAPVAKTQLVKISVDMADAKTATHLANELASKYIENQLEARLAMTQTATSWMNQRMVGLKENLQDSERRLQAYREQENLVDLKGVTTISAESLSDISTRLSDARNASAQAESQYRQVSTMRHSDIERLSSVPAVLANPLVQQFKSEHANAIAKVQELSRRYGPKHPKMIAAQSDARSTKYSLRNQVDLVVAGIHKNYQLAKSNETSLSLTYQENKSEIQDISRKEFKLRELQLEVNTNRSLYNTFLERLKETSATSDLDTANARVVDKAVLPTIPVKPQKELIVILAGLLSLIVSVGLTLLADAFDKTFQTSTQVEDRFNLPVLGNVPLVANSNKKYITQLFLNNKDKFFSESIRGIRTGLMLSSLEDKHRIIMLTSSVPSEGKSSICSNLALSLGQMDRTLLIDADMRRPTLGKHFNLKSGTPGLANLVSGNATFEECLMEQDGIFILGTGAVPPNPLELLSSPKFGQILNALKESFTYIVIDSPPILAVSDPLMIATHADQLLYVIRSDSTYIDQVDAGIGQLLQNNLRITGTILNQVDTKKAQYHNYRYGGKYNGYYA